MTHSANPTPQGHYNWEKEYAKVEKKSWFARFWWMFVIVFVLVALCVGGSMIVSRAADTAAEFKGVATQPAPTTSPKQSGAATTFGDGTWLLGKDIKAGRYKAVVPAKSFGCYWERLKATDGEVESINANGFRKAGEQAIVTLDSKKDVAFTSNGCGVWTRV